MMIDVRCAHRDAEVFAQLRQGVQQRCRVDAAAEGDAVVPRSRVPEQTRQ